MDRCLWYINLPNAGSEPRMTCQTDIYSVSIPNCDWVYYYVFHCPQCNLRTTYLCLRIYVFLTYVIFNTYLHTIYEITYVCFKP